MNGASGFPTFLSSGSFRHMIGTFTLFQLVLEPTLPVDEQG
jgi:hypothetical protein